MPTSARSSIRLLPDGTPLHNRLLAALPARDYARILKHVQMTPVITGRTLQEPVSYTHLTLPTIYSV